MAVEGGSASGSPVKRSQAHTTAIDGMEGATCDVAVLFIVLHGGWFVTLYIIQ